MGALPPAHSFPLGIQYTRRGLECLGKQSGGNRQRRQSDSAGKPRVKLARRRECRCRRQKAIEVGYRALSLVVVLDKKDRDEYVQKRDMVATKMTPAHIVETQAGSSCLRKRPNAPVASPAVKSVGRLP